RVVICVGYTCQGRVAASLLHAVGMPELITRSLEDYESLAMRLAQDAELLAFFKAKLANNRNTFPLFNTQRFTRHLEAAYTTMWWRHQNAEPPPRFVIAPVD